MKIYIGIDVGKFNLDIFYLNKNLQVTNDSKGITALLKNFKIIYLILVILLRYVRLLVDTNSF